MNYRLQHYFKKNILFNFILLYFTFIGTTFSQNAGFFGSPLSSVIYNDGNANDQEANVFDGTNLGLITTLELNGARIRSFKNGGADVTGAFIHYRVYEQGTTPPAFNAQSINFAANLGGGDQRWEQSTLTIDLLSGLTGGDYTFEVFFRITTTGCCGGEVFQSNSGSNYSADFSISYNTANSGDWDVSGTWDGGAIPPSNANVVIQHDVTLNTNATVSTIDVRSGNTFTGSDGTARTLSIADGGNFTNNGTFTATANNTVSFAGAGTISGSSTFNDVDIAGGVDFGSGSTIDGNLTIESGGFVNNQNPPSYSTNSTLVYSIDNTSFGRGDEWSSTSGAGYPNNVIIQDNTTLDLGANGGAGTAREIAGNLTVSSGSTLSLDDTPMTAALTVNGNFINDGTVELSSDNAGGGDLRLQGDFDDNGTFTANGRAVFFEGGNTQNINSNSNPLEIDVIRIDKTGGEVVMDANLLADETQDPLQFSNATSFLNLNGFDLTLGKDGVVSSVTYNGGSFRGNASSNLTIEGDGAFGDLIFDSSNDDLATLTVSRENSGSVTLASTLNATSLSLESGELILSNADDLDGDVVLDGGDLTTGASTGNAETLGTLNLQVNSSINLGTGSHTLTFGASNGVSWAGGSVLTVNGWSGTAGTAGSSNDGAINMTNSSGLNATQLGQVQFPGHPQGAVLSGTGELLPEFAETPTSAASGISFTSVGANNMTINWTDGDGSDRLVVVREASAVDFSPSNGVNYSANTDFSAGTGVGPSNDNKVVFNGNSATNVTVTDLNQSTTYHVAIYEYNGSGGSTESYFTSGAPTGSQATTTNIFTTVTTAGNFNWSSTSAWQGGVVPSSGSDIEIRTDLTLDQDATVGDVTIFSGASLTSESGQSRTLTLEGGATLTNNGSFTANDGTVSFTGTGTISGSLDFNNIDIAGGVDFGSSSTVNGTLAVNSGGFASNNNAPTYGPSSTLEFNTGGSFNIDNTTTLWTTGASVGQGVPNNVLVSSTDPLNIFEARDVIGDLTISSNGRVFQGQNAFIVQGSIIINSGTLELDINGTDALQLEGDFTNDGTFTPNGRALALDGSAGQTLSGTSTPLTFDDIEVQNTSGVISFNDDVTVNNDLTLDPGARVDAGGVTTTVSGTANLNASASGYSQFLGDMGTSSVSWDSYLDGGGGSSPSRWHNVAIPVVGATLDDVGFNNAAFLQANGNSSSTNVWTYDASAVGGTDPEGDWVPESDLTTGNLDGKGFSIYLDDANFGSATSTLNVLGEFFAGSKTISIEPQGSTPSNNGYGWNFIGNPFPCAIHWDDVATGNSDITSTYWIFNDDTGQWIAYNEAASGTTPGATGGGSGANSTASDFIAPGQSFFVQAANSNSGASMTIDNNDRDISGTPTINKRSKVQNALTILTRERKSGNQDFTWMGFEMGMTDNLDSRVDATKLFNDKQEFPAIYTKGSQNEMIYNFLDDQFSYRTVDLYLEYEQDQKSLEIEGFFDYLDPSWSVLLEDKLKNRTVNLRNQNYTFTHNTANMKQRFTLHINKGNYVGSEELDVTEVYAFVEGDQLKVNLEQWSGQGMARVYDLQGRVIASQEVSGGNTSEVSLSGYAPGLYVVKVTAQDEEVLTQKIIK